MEAHCLLDQSMETRMAALMAQKRDRGHHWALRMVLRLGPRSVMVVWNHWAGSLECHWVQMMVGHSVLGPEMDSTKELQKAQQKVLRLHLDLWKDVGLDWNWGQKKEADSMMAKQMDSEMDFQRALWKAAGHRLALQRDLH